MKNYLTNTSLRELFPHFLLAGLALFLFSGNLFAGSASLAWDASTSSNVGGYKISYGLSSGNYTSTIDVGNTTTYTVPGLTAGTKYYFAAKAYDTTKTAESVYSNETNLTVPVTTALTADFTENKTSGVATLAVDFTPVTTGTVTSWTWSFPGSYTPTVTNTTAKVTTASYPTAGTYSVSLTVTGSSGSVTKTYPNLITVTAPSTTTSTGTTSTGTTTTSTGTVTSNTGLVAAYGFDEVSGTTVADASGKGNNGTISNAVRITNGHSGNALQFNGTNAWVTVTDSASLDLSTSMTLEAWVYPTTITSEWRDVIYKGNDSYYLEATSSASSSSPAGGGTFGEVYGTAALAANTWTHLAVTYDGATLRQFVNGVQVSSKATTGNIATSANPLQIGGDNIYGQYFQGYIDEVRIYNRALSSDEVNYNLKTPISVSNPPQFVMGDNTKEPWVDYKPQGTAQAYRTTPQNTGVVTTVQVYLDASSTATELVAGIYKNYKGHPRALVAQGKLSTLKPGAWNSVPIPVASVTAGQPYWIAILGSKGQIGFLDLLGSGTGKMESSTSTTLTSLPSTWTGSVYKANSNMSVFGDGY